MKAYKYNQDWYAIKYSLAALHANESVRARSKTSRPLPPSSHRSDKAKAGSLETEKHRIVAFEQTTDLAVACGEALDELCASRWAHPAIAFRRSRAASARRRKALRAYLEDAMLPAALVLLAGVTREKPGGTGVKNREQMLQVLREERAGRDELVDYVSGLPGRDELVDYVSGLPGRSPRVEYNLACVHAEGGDADAARKALASSLAGTPVSQRWGLAERARLDPTLDEAIKKIPGEKSAKTILEWVKTAPRADDVRERSRRSSSTPSS